jgi:signal transduction histidine kinase
MSTQLLTKETNAMPNPQGDTHTRLRGRRLFVARASWLAMAILMLGVFLAILPTRYRSHFIETLVIPRRWTNIHVNHSTSVARDNQGIEADFTPSLEKVGPLTADLVYAGRGCNADLPYNVDVRDRIVLIDRGACIFFEKVQNAEKAGAVGVIVANDQSGPLGNMVGYSRANIPAMLITKMDGDALREILAEKTTNVTLSFSFADPSPAAKLGLSREFYAGYRLALNLGMFIASMLMSLIIFWHRSEDWMALLVALAFLAIATTPVSSWDVRSDDFLLGLNPLGRLIVEFIAVIGDISVFIVIFLLFPNGRFAPRWMWVIAVLSVPWIIIRHIFHGAPPRLGDPIPLPSLLITLGFYAIAIFAQVYRYRYVSTLIQREQTKWVVFGLAVAVLGYYAPDVGLLMFPALASLSTSSVLYNLATYLLGTFSIIFALLTFAIAIVGHRLWDVDIIINRTLVYGALTAIVIGIYMIVVGTLGTIIQGRSNLLISILATGLVAVLVQPLRDWLQRGVNRMMYGERDDPVTVLSRLGQRLEATIAPEAVLPALTETIAQTLKLPYVAIHWESDGESHCAVSYGQPVDDLIEFPLTHHGVTRGQLVVAPRSPGEALSSMDRHLLENIAHQAGMTVHAASLTADLQRSRQQLVTTREEERRRLRRDLHDGLGPNLASQGLKLAAVKQLAEKNPSSAIPLLEQVMAQNQSTVEEVRRLVYGLRPPALDELGLVAAIRDHVAGMDHNVSLQIEIAEPPEGLSSLTAATEVAAYRIVLEALTNVIRHAHAQRCVIRFSLDQNSFRHSLQIEIKDDGIGLPRRPRVGVGTRSMRERAEEVGGTWVIESVAGGGTRVCVRVPLIVV